MPTILVPGPSPDAFNKQRRISDLLHSQITHFQHLVQKRSLSIDPALAKDVHTEAGAARYIAAVTRAIRGAAAATTGPFLLPTPATLSEGPAESPVGPPETGTLSAIAAAATTAHPGRERRRARPKPAPEPKP